MQFSCFILLMEPTWKPFLSSKFMMLLNQVKIFWPTAVLSTPQELHCWQDSWRWGQRWPSGCRSRCGLNGWMLQAPLTSCFWCWVPVSKKICFLETWQSNQQLKTVWFQIQGYFWRNPATTVWCNDKAVWICYSCGFLTGFFYLEPSSMPNCFSETR